MSLKSWKAEFYPIVASKVSKKNALAHSLQKWEGLLKKNLIKHGLKMEKAQFGYISHPNESTLEMVTTDECSLCYHYIDRENEIDCDGCPINELPGNTCCMKVDSPYNRSIKTENPMPRINLLKKAIKAQTNPRP